MVHSPSPPHSAQGFFFRSLKVGCALQSNLKLPLDFDYCVVTTPRRKVSYAKWLLCVVSVIDPLPLTLPQASNVGWLEIFL